MAMGKRENPPSRPVTASMIRVGTSGSIAVMPTRGAGSGPHAVRHMQSLFDKDKQEGGGYLLTPPESSAKRLWRANNSPKAVKQLLTTDAR